MSAIDTKKGVPGVPLAALSAIQDQNTRQVLQAIVDGWHVRNGSSGSGSSRFITAAELGDLSGQVGGLRNLIDQQRQSGAVLTAAQISRVITDLEASVMESVLFKELGDRINLIDQNAIDGLKAEAIARQAAITTEATTRQTADTSLANQIFTVTAAVNTNAAAIQNEVTARVNGDNSLSQQISTQIATVNGNLSALQTQQTTTANNVAALSQSISTLQITVGQNIVALQEESTVRANTDNDIYAKYSVKIDNNGYVSGFGLMSTSNNSAPFSEFIVRADRFAIGSPTGPGITPTVPFIVLTTPDANGNQPGVYMRNAMIANAAIGTAQIDDLAVNTLKIDGGSVTSMAYQEGAGGSLGAAGGEYVAQVDLSMPTGSSGVVLTGSVLMSGTGGNATVWLMIGKTPVGATLGGGSSTLIKLTGVSLFGGFYSSFSITAFDPSPAGDYTYWLAVKNPTSGPGSNASFAYEAPSITAVGGKR